MQLFPVGSVDQEIYVGEKLPLRISRAPEFLDCEPGVGDHAQIPVPAQVLHEGGNGVPLLEGLATGESQAFEVRPE